MLGRGQVRLQLLLGLGVHLQLGGHLHLHGLESLIQLQHLILEQVDQDEGLSES